MHFPAKYSISSNLATLSQRSSLLPQALLPSERTTRTLSLKQQKNLMMHHTFIPPTTTTTTTTTTNRIFNMTFDVLTAVNTRITFLRVAW